MTQTKQPTHITIRIHRADAERLRKIARGQGMTITGLFRRFTDELTRHLDVPRSLSR